LFAAGGLLFAAFSAPFWLAGVQLLRSSFGQFLTRSRLEVGPRKWRISTELAALKDGVTHNPRKKQMKRK
jgi:hypothetical protein